MPDPLTYLDDGRWAGPNVTVGGLDPFWGAPVWSDMRASRTEGSLDPAKWNVRDSSTFGNIPDYGVIEENNAFVDAEGYMVLRCSWRVSPSVSTVGGGTASYTASNDTITTPSAHDMGAGQQVYIASPSNAGITEGYYYVVSAPTSTTMTVSPTRWPYPASAPSVYNITQDGTCTVQKHRHHDSAYIDHRLLNGGDVQPTANQYGRWEMRAQVPTLSLTEGGSTLGTLPGFWLRNGSSGEIDIMESWGGRTDSNRDTSTLTFHEFTTGGGWKYAWTWEDEAGFTQPVANDFHVWALERHPTVIKGFFDGVEVINVTSAQNSDLWGSTHQSPWYLRVSHHIGPSGRYYGIPDPTSPYDADTADDLDFKIDYIKVWEYPS